MKSDFHLSAYSQKHATWFGSGVLYFFFTILVLSFRTDSSKKPVNFQNLWN